MEKNKHAENETINNAQEFWKISYHPRSARAAQTVIDYVNKLPSATTLWKIAHAKTISSELQSPDCFCWAQSSRESSISSDTEFQSCAYVWKHKFFSWYFLKKPRSTWRWVQNADRYTESSQKKENGLGTSTILTLFLPSQAEQELHDSRHF